MNVINWSVDPDWDAVVKSAEHAQHHLLLDRFGNEFCRECNRNLTDQEVKRLLIMERPISPVVEQLRKKAQ